MTNLVSDSVWKPRGIAELETNADWAVRTTSNALVVAGPGAGKTELLAQRACFLLETGACPYPRRILAISFKRDAARNLRERVMQRCGLDLGRRFDSFTFDAFAKGLLDQFSSALPEALRPTPIYDVLPGGPRAAHVEEILGQMVPPREFGTSNDLRAFVSEIFYKNKVLPVPFGKEPDDLEKWAAREFWHVLLHGGPTSRLYFPMITRLAGHAVRTDARVARVYRSTYTHVFLDEFQDTTDLQYWLTRALFSDTSAILTAVGDAQQRIMVWAGARKDVFSKYREQFKATQRRLERNRRASSEIAPVVAYLAARLREEYGEADDKLEGDDLLAASGPPAEACAAVLFDDASSEAEWLAEEIKGLLDTGIAPREICILARQKATDYAQPVMKELAAIGIESRLEETLQDLLTEPVVTISLLALRATLSATPAVSWATFRGEIAQLQGIDLMNADALTRLDQSLQALRRQLRQAYTVPPTDAETLRSILRNHIEPLFRVALCNRHGQYKRGPFYEDQLVKLCATLQSQDAGESWDSVFDRVEGKRAVPILTIHKSKGLEYAAVFFIGLEDSAFWNFRRQPDEELNTFYVALSRAKNRVVFTFAAQRDVGRYPHQTRSSIAKVYELLTEAGVPIVDRTRRNS